MKLYPQASKVQSLHSVGRRSRSSLPRPLVACARMPGRLTTLKLRIATHIDWRLGQLQQEMLRSQVGACGDRVVFGREVRIFRPELLRIGDDCRIADHTVLWADGGLTIGARVLVSVNCAITTTTHSVDLAERATGMLVTAPIKIEDDVWVGANAAVLPGVTLGKGAVVGAGAVVTRDVAPGATVVGVPARPV